MKKLVIIEDALRLDTANVNLMPKFKGKYYLNVKAAGENTRIVFEKIKELFDQAPIPLIMLTGGGYASKIRHNWEAVYYSEKTSCPLFEKNVYLPAIEKANEYEDVMLLIHDYYMHQYWKDTDIKAKDLIKCRVGLEQMARGRHAYEIRGKRFTNAVSKFLKSIDLSEWVVVVTADHAEAFYDDGKHYHHGACARDGKVVYQIPWIELGNRFKLEPKECTFERLFLNFIKQ